MILPIVELLRADLPERKVEGHWTTDYDALETQRAVAASLLTEMFEALESIAEDTDPDAPEENYRADDREGCLDAVFATAREAVGNARTAVEKIKGER